jgi:hypothetical protein
MKNIISAWKTFVLLVKYPNLSVVVKGVFELIKITHEKQIPMIQHIAMLNMKDGNKIGDLVTLWAGTGDSNLIHRAETLKAQNTELKRLLKLATDKNNVLNDEDRDLIALTIKHFN